MNIFATSKCPIKSAQALDDKRVIKMILESAQMLATALLVNKAPKDIIPISKVSGDSFKIAHKNHPCTIWARTTRGNYIWLWRHFTALVWEYSYRYKKDHYLGRFVLTLSEGASYIPEGPKLRFANCSLYKDMPTIKAYRKTMKHKWENDVRKPTWKRKKNIPSWVLRSEE